MGLFCQSDKEGRFKWSPRLLKTQIDPYEEKIDFKKVMDALHKYEFIEKYKVGRKEYGWIPTWSEHQRPHHTETASKLPSFDTIDIQPLNNGEETGSSQEGKEKGKDTGEGKGKEKVEISNKEIFEKAREEYLGTKNGKNPEYENFLALLKKKKLKESEVLPLLLPAIQGQEEWRKNVPEDTFVPARKNFQTWINQQCWTQELPRLEGTGKIYNISIQGNHFKGTKDEIYSQVAKEYHNLIPKLLASQK